MVFLTVAAMLWILAEIDYFTVQIISKRHGSFICLQVQHFIMSSEVNSCEVFLSSVVSQNLCSNQNDDLFCVIQGIARLNGHHSLIAHSLENFKSNVLFML